MQIVRPLGRGGDKLVEISQAGHKTAGHVPCFSLVIKRFIANFAGIIINSFCFRSTFRGSQEQGQGQGAFAASFALFFMLHLPARHNKGVSLRSHNGDNGGTAAAAATAIRLINEWDQTGSPYCVLSVISPI